MEEEGGKRARRNHIEMILSIEGIVRLYNVGVYSSLANLRLILTLIKITVIVITVSEEKIKSGL